MENFTPLAGLGGGLLIGAAASLFVMLNGRVLGISGILGGLLGATGADLAVRLVLLGGVVAGPLLLSAVRGTATEIAITASLPVLAIAGILVGFGTRFGNGCTSGHGVCGLARGSIRSLVATAVFFGAAAVTVYVTRHVLVG